MRLGIIKFPFQEFSRHQEGKLKSKQKHSSKFSEKLITVDQELGHFKTAVSRVFSLQILLFAIALSNHLPFLDLIIYF